MNYKVNYQRLKDLSSTRVWSSSPQKMADKKGLTLQYSTTVLWYCSRLEKDLGLVFGFEQSNLCWGGFYITVGSVAKNC